MSWSSDLVASLEVQLMDQELDQDDASPPSEQEAPVLAWLCSGGLDLSFDGRMPRMPWAASAISYRRPWRCKARICRLQQEPCGWGARASGGEVSSSSRSQQQPRVEAPLSMPERQKLRRNWAGWPEVCALPV